MIKKKKKSVFKKKSKEKMPEELKQQDLSGTFIYNKYLIKQLEKNKPEGGHMHSQIIKKLTIKFMNHWQTGMWRAAGTEKQKNSKWRNMD